MTTKYFKCLLTTCIFCWTPVFSGFAQYYDDTLRFQSTLNLDIIFKKGIREIEPGRLAVIKKPNDTPIENVEVKIFTDFLIPDNSFNNVLIYQKIAEITPVGVYYYAKRGHVIN
jgi:hypothetical protein